MSCTRSPCCPPGSLPGASASDRVVCLRTRYGASSGTRPASRAVGRSADESASAVWNSAPVAPELPDRARVVVIGGGVIGASIAYHLGHLGWGADVVLLERDRLTSGTTWHAAGLMTCFGSFSETSTAMRLYSRDLYARLEAETGQATGFKPVGLIEAAADADRLEEYRRVAAFQRHLGLEVDEISPAEMNALFPWAKTDDLLAGFHVPGDGRVNPVDLTTALAKGARQLGVRVIEGVTVTDVVTETRGRVESVTGVRVGRRAGGVRVRRQRHRHVGARARAEVRAQRAQHGGRALLPDHRHDRGPRAGHPGLRGPGRARLLPRGGRRDDGRPLRAARRRVAPRGRAGRVVVHHPQARLGADVAVPGDRDGTGAGDVGRRGPHVLLRTGVVHARPVADRRRGAGHPRATSWPPA